MTEIEWVRRHTARSRDRLRMIGGLTILFVSIIAIALAVLALLPLQFQQAQRRWQEHGLRHYQVEVAWASGWSFGHARVEMRDNKLVAATDLDTGKPIDTSKRLDAAYFGSIDTLFSIVELRVRPAWNWRNLLARALPSLARRIDSCVAPLSDVRYDAQYGYPSIISYNDGWCSKNTFFSYSKVTITQFTPLP